MALRQKIKINAGSLPIQTMELPTELSIFEDGEATKIIGRAFGINWNGQHITGEVEVLNSADIPKVKQKPLSLIYQLDKVLGIEMSS